MPINLTPAHLRCAVTISCPSVTRLDDGRLRIVGKIDPSLTVNEDGSPIDPEKWDGIGQDETAIIISPDLLADYVAQVNGESLRDRAADELSPDGA